MNITNIIQRKLSTGLTKTYYSIDNEFEAVGTLFIDRNMYYTAAHPTEGLWLSGRMMNNEILPLGLIPWDNITRMIIDKESDVVYIEISDVEQVMQNADFAFRKMYRKTFTHIMSDSGMIAIAVDKDLFSVSLLAYIQERVHTEIREEEITREEETRSIILSILYIIFIIAAIILLYYKYIAPFFT